MDILSQLIEMFPTIGFSGCCVVAMGFFVHYIYEKTSAQTQKLIDGVQESCSKREERLYNEIAENRKVNAQAIETIAKYAEILNTIQEDVDDIKTDIARISNSMR